jgi:hypothetical protein
MKLSEHSMEAGALAGTSNMISTPKSMSISSPRRPKTVQRTGASDSALTACREPMARVWTLTLLLAAAPLFIRPFLSHLHL